MSGSSWAYRIAGVSLDVVSDNLTDAQIRCAGLSEDGGTTTAWFHRRPAGAMPLAGTWEKVPDIDWSEAWKDGLEPVTSGRVTVLPPWLAPDGPITDVDIDDPNDPIVLVIEPGLAFGTGHHETTSGCLLALQQLDLRGRHVIDVGTGTGVLALAARALGAGRVTAVDIDPQAITVARQNLAAHSLDDVTLRVGSCAEVGDTGQVVIANIITDLLLRIADDLAELLAPDGVLVTSGVSNERLPDAVARFERAGLSVEATAGTAWAMLLGRRDPLPENLNAPR